MASKKISTGEILPRDYGVTIRMRGRKFFLSPSKYAIAKIILESPQEIRSRVQRKAERDGVDPSELEEALVTGVQRVEKTQNLLRVHGRNALKDVRMDSGITYDAFVKSKRRRTPSHYPVTLRGSTVDDKRFGYETLVCDCADRRWNDVRNFQAMCVHLSVLELALYLDTNSRASTQDNLTGLLPRERPDSKERPDRPSMPFDFFSGGSMAGDAEITDVLFDHYVEGKPFREISRDLLQIPGILDETLEQMMEAGWGRYEILRGSEKKVARDSTTPTSREMYGAIKALEGRLVGMMRGKQYGFEKTGYTLEFIGTSWEVVAQRFDRGDNTYSLCIKEGMPPIIVAKTLRPRHGLELRYPGDTQKINSPFHQRISYMSLDDATGRIGETRIIIPGVGRGKDIEVPQILERRYQRLMAS